MAKEHPLVIALGLGRKPDGGSGPPPSAMDALSRPQSRPSPARMDNPTQSPTEPNPQMGAGQSTASARKQSNFKNCEAMCGNCTYWTRETGNCEKGNGDVDAGDTCDWYEDIRPGAGADQDGDASAESDNDADDMGAMMGINTPSSPSVSGTP